MADEPIIGATASAYTLGPLDVGRELYCRVVGTNLFGSDTVNSNIVGPVVPGIAPPFNAGGADAPDITGTPAVDETLSCAVGVWSGDEPITYTYQWHRESGFLFNVVPPVVTGVVGDGEELSTDDGEWVGEAPVTFTYQWYKALTDDEGEILYDDDGKALGVPHFGATSPTYVIGGIPVAPESTWNVADTIDLILSNGNLTAEANPYPIVPYGGVTRMTQARNTGKRYYELVITQLDIDTGIMTGMCDDTVPLANGMTAGISGASGNAGFTISILSYGGGGFCRAQHDTVGFSFEAMLTGDVWTTGDVLGVAVDLDVHAFWLAKNNVWLAQGIYGGAPDSSAGINWGGLAGPLKMFCTLNNSPSGTGPIEIPAIVTLNTGASPFAFIPPTGFVAWETPE